jgi:hypothetical protein
MDSSLAGGKGTKIGGCCPVGWGRYAGSKNNQIPAQLIADKCDRRTDSNVSYQERWSLSFANAYEMRCYYYTTALRLSITQILVSPVGVCVETRRRPMKNVKNHKSVTFQA